MVQPDCGAGLIVPDGWREFGTMWAQVWREQPLHCCFPSPGSRRHGLSKWPKGLGQCSLLSDWRGGLVGRKGRVESPFRRMEMEQPGLAGRAGDHQPVPSPKEPFGINLLKMEEGSSPHPQFCDAMSEACRCCLNVVIVSSLRCDLCLRHEDPSSPSAQLTLLSSFYYSRLSPLPDGLCLP